ncbi:MAG: hypothetical protein ACXVC6_10035 [Bacteroidia bacterium]
MKTNEKLISPITLGSVVSKGINNLFSIEDLNFEIIISDSQGRVIGKGHVVGGGGNGFADDRVKTGKGHVVGGGGNGRADGRVNNGKGHVVGQGGNG